MVEGRYTGLVAPALASREAPEVSVVISVHNGLPYVEPAIRSMMAQSLRNIEIIVVDDASTDQTPEVLTRLAREDGRIRVETLATNLKLAGALNHGLQLVRAPLVARMDADDWSLPDRLMVQASFMNRHPEVILVGSSTKEIDDAGREIRTDVKSYNDFATRWIARFYSPLIHPTFMFRARLPDGERTRYDPAFVVGQDYDLIARLFPHGQIVNLPDVLHHFRVHASSITGRNWNLQQEVAWQVAERHSERELPPHLRSALEPVRTAFHARRSTDPAAIFEGLRQMMAYDVARHPEERVWLRQFSARLARQALNRSGRSRGQILRDFLGPGLDFSYHMAMRAADARIRLPLVERLRSSAR